MNRMPDIETVRTHRVGTVSAGLCLIGTGVLFLLNIFTDLIELTTILSLWPVILILLGIELLFSLSHKDRVVYDGGAIALLILMFLFACAMGTLYYIFTSWTYLHM